MNCKYWTQEVGEIVSLIKELYKKEPAGGMLHIVVDDGNLEDEHLQWCIDYCNREENANRHDKLMCLDIANRMLELTYEQRVLVYYMEMSFECKGDCMKCAVERVIEDDENLW